MIMFLLISYLPSCTSFVDCGWAAFAGINSWYSFYQGTNYYKSAVQMHELGHNFNMAHSGGLNGQTYTDHTGAMGNPLYSDEVGKVSGGHWFSILVWSTRLLMQVSFLSP